MVKRKTRRKSSKKRSVKPIGYTKQGKKYAFVFGSKSKPRLGKSRYSSMSTLKKAYSSKYRK